MSKTPVTEYREERYSWANDVRLDGPGSTAPHTIEPGVFALWLEDGVPVFCEFRCPCGCGAFCPTYLTNKEGNIEPGHPRWTYSPGPTLTPSIRYLGGCKSHFNITNGKVVMHGDSGK